jgi:hypothetical protein
MKRIESVKYICERCFASYEDEGDAWRCESQPFDPEFGVGDIVTAHAGFGWYDGDRKWIRNPEVVEHEAHDLTLPGVRCKLRRNPDHGNCFGDCCSIAFYYVVTAVGNDARNPHRIEYHVATKGMKCAYRGGRTYDQGHHTLSKVEHPPADIVAASLDLLGKRFERLL